MKKGQITIFIILGILILIVFGVVFYADLKKSSPTDSSVVEDYVSTCLNKAAADGVYLIASQGGYLNPKGDLRYEEQGDGQPAHYYLGNSVLPYVLNGKEISMRELPELIPYIETYTELELPKCLNWSAFADYKITTGKPEVSIIANNFETKVAAQYPIRLSKGDEVLTLEKFSTSVPLRIALLEKTAQKLVNNIALAHANTTAYNLFQHCGEYKSDDELVNIYSTQNAYAADYAVVIVDALPVKYGMAPLRYQFALRNVLFGGLCVG